MIATPDSIRPGTHLGVWTVEEPLGAGGMGHVFRGRDAEGRIVALKLVRAPLDVDDYFRRRFAREVEVMQRIRHPRVVPILATGEHEGVPFLVQPLLAGGSLDDRLKRDGRLAIDETCVLLCEVAAGLDALHIAGLIHRDLKPANVLLDERGQAHVADLGIAKVSGASELTRVGESLGSPDYMAPEQVRGDAVTPATDVYALGCLAVACLVGEPPFAKTRGLQRLWAHLYDDPPDPAAEREDLSTAGGIAVLQALAKDPEERPPSAGAYARSVEMETRT